MAVWNVTNLSYINSKGRFDAEYFQKEFEVLDSFVSQGIPISKISRTVDLQSNGAFKVIFEILNDNREKIVPYIRSGNVGDFFLNLDELHKISEVAHNNLPKTHTKVGDVLMARKGKIGGATIISKNEEGYNSNDNVVNIRITDKRFLPEYFVAFWNSKFGLDQVRRFSTGNVQPWLSMKQVRMLKTVLLSIEKQAQVSEIVAAARIKSDLSKSLYTQAQEVLVNALNLKQLVIDKPKSYEANFSEVVSSHRIDAQCFNPEQFDYEKYIRKQGNYHFLRDVVKSLIKGKQKKASTKGDLNYVSIKDVQGFEIFSDEKCWLGSNTAIAEAEDLLLAITGATIGKIGIVSRDEKLAFSGDLLAIKSNEKIHPYYLLAVMLSPVGQSQCIRWITGSTNGHLSLSDVAKFVIPRLSKSSEDKIASLLIKSITAKNESERCLAQAKRQVEELIEGAAQ